MPLFLSTPRVRSLRGRTANSLATVRIIATSFFGRMTNDVATYRLE